jgi:hypothetical protein
MGKENRRIRDPISMQTGLMALHRQPLAMA